MDKTPNGDSKQTDSPTDAQGRFSWLAVAATAIITGVVTFGGNWLLEAIKTAKPSLSFVESESITFEDGQERRGIFLVRVKSDGGHLAEDVRLDIALAPWKIDKHFVTTSAGVAALTEIGKDSSEVKVTTQLLNPTEFIEAAFMLVQPKSAGLTVPPRVALRGRGVIGVKSSKSEPPSWMYTSVFMMAATVAGMAASLNLLLNRRIRDRRGPFVGESPRDVLQSLASLHCAQEDMIRYASTSTSMRYWVESDYLTRLILDQPDGKYTKQRNAVLLALVDADFVAPSSRAIVACNIAKISLEVDGDAGVAAGWVAKAKKLDARAAAARIQSDPLLEKYR